MIQGLGLAALATRALPAISRLGGSGRMAAFSLGRMSSSDSSKNQTQSTQTAQPSWQDLTKI